MTPKATAPNTKTTAYSSTRVENGRARLLLGERRVHRPGGAAARRRRRRKLVEAVGDGHAARKPIPTRFAASSGATIRADRSSCEVPRITRPRAANSIMKRVRMH